MKNRKASLITMLFISLLITSCGKGKKDSSSTTSFSSSSETSSLVSDSESSLEESSIDSSSDIESSDFSSDSSAEIEDEFVLASAPFYIPVSSNGNYVKQLVRKFDYGYYKDNACFVYMPIDNIFDFLFTGFNETISIHFYQYETSDGLVMSIYPEENIIRFVNYDETNLFSKANDGPMGVIDEAHTKGYVQDGGTTYEGGEAVTFDLEKYELDIVEKDNRVFVPFSIINNVFFTSKYYSPICFNGTGFYLLDMLNEVVGLNGGTGNTYLKDYYNGAFRGQTRSAKFIHDNFKALMFQLDHFYGFLDERMVPFENYLSENYPSVITSLQSENNNTYTDAVNKILDGIIGDGHTNSGSASTVFGNGTYSGQSYSSDREMELSNASYQCYMSRYSAIGTPDLVRYKNNTAIVSFDGFYHQPVKFTKSNINYYNDDDGFALFYYVFEQIQKRDIKNIIFDVTCNGGGDTNALIPMLGFLTRKVELTMYNPLSKKAGHLAYNVDTNLDGVYDDNDSFEGQYNFFVLTSRYSFSCANLFTMVCQNSELATIIGQQSGGGACVVSYTATPDGKPFRISGLSRNGFKNDIAAHNDYGVPVDVSIDSVSNFYNDTYLYNLVNSL